MNWAGTVVALLAAQLAAAPPPKLIREIDLNRIIHEHPGLLPSDHSVRALAFSPDESRIAVAVGLHRKEGKFQPSDHPYESHLLILPLTDPSDRAAIQIDPGVPLSEGSVIWSPDSTALVAQSVPYAGFAGLYNVRGDALWTRHLGTSDLGDLGPDMMVSSPRGWIAGFLDPRHLLARSIPGRRKPTGFISLDLHGRIADMWTLPQRWIVEGLNPDRDLLAVSSGDRRKTVIIEYPSKNIVQTRSNPTWITRDNFRVPPDPRILFTESGKTLCSVVSSLVEHDTEAECSDVDTGATIAKFRRFLGGAPAVGSAHGSRLVLTQVSRFPKAGVDGYGDRVVWDFRSGAEVAAWETTGQISEFVNSARSDIVQLAPVAISPTGRYVAEGSNGILRIYEVH